MDPMHVVGAVTAGLLLVYLVVTLLKPEWLS